MEGKPLVIEEKGVFNLCGHGRSRAPRILAPSSNLISKAEQAPVLNVALAQQRNALLCIAPVTGLDEPSDRCKRPAVLSAQAHAPLLRPMLHSSASALYAII